MSKEYIAHRDIKKDISCRFPLINAVVQGIQKGTVFQQVANDPESYFVLHKAGFSYLILPERFNSYPALSGFIENTHEIPEYFHIYDPPEKIISCIESEKEIFNTRLRKRVQLQYTGKIKIDVPASSLQAGYSIKRITSDNFNAMASFELSLNSKFWNSEEDFLTNGYGFCMFNEEKEALCVCYTACIADGVAEIDIATLPIYRNKGFASIVVAAFVNHSIENNIIANWDCFEENIASLKTAQKLKFEEKYRYPFLSIFKKNYS